MHSERPPFMTFQLMCLNAQCVVLSLPNTPLHCTSCKDCRNRGVIIYKYVISLMKRISWIKIAKSTEDAKAASIGKRVLGGCPRALHALYQDGIAITRKTGKANLLITIIRNPPWRKVVLALLPGGRAIY